MYGIQDFYETRLWRHGKIFQWLLVRGQVSHGGEPISQCKHGFEQSIGRQFFDYAHSRFIELFQHGRLTDTTFAYMGISKLFLTYRYVKLIHIEDTSICFDEEL